ncbi:MAG: NIPSNAP family protein [Proteobacteria bacterium]|nr:NIPSNAP family protein [Pseudomonadota bacterium]
MFVEERMYLLYPGKVQEYFSIYENEGMPTQLKHLPHMVGYYFTEVGVQNLVVHMWAYDDLNQRDRCRAAMQADPAWKAYTARIRPLIVSQETRIMKPAPFFKARLERMLSAK